MSPTANPPAHTCLGPHARRAEPTFLQGSQRGLHIRIIYEIPDMIAITGFIGSRSLNHVLPPSRHTKKDLQPGYFTSDTAAKYLPTYGLTHRPRLGQSAPSHIRHLINRHCTAVTLPASPTLISSVYRVRDIVLACPCCPLYSRPAV